MWGPPAESNAVITGYQLKFFGLSSRTVNKLPTESYHVVTDNDIRNLGSDIRVSVRNSILACMYICVNFLTSCRCEQRHLLVLDHLVL